MGGDTEGPDGLLAGHGRAGADRFELTLYVSGASPRSRRAIKQIRKLCDEELEGRFELQVVDLHQQPALAAQQGIVAAPTLIRRLPLPLRTLVGDLSDTERVLVGLELHPLPSWEDRGEGSSGGDERYE